MPTTDPDRPLDGRCTCGGVRYRLHDLPTQWPAASLARRAALMPRILAWRAARDWSAA